MKYSVLIADDEPHARAHLQRLVENAPDLQFLGTCANGNEVVEYCKTLSPDIILLDIEMPVLNGLETARKLAQRNTNSLIIFITAYDQHAVTAFELEAIGYLLKPFSSEDFTKVINKAQQQIDMQQKVDFNARIEHLWQRMQRPNPAYLEYLEIKDKGLIRKISVADINCIISDSEYIQLYTLTSNYLYRKSLELISSQLPAHFKRVHRSHTVNTKKIKSWKYLNNGTYQFELTNDITLKSSRSYQESIKKWLVELSMTQ